VGVHSDGGEVYEECEVRRQLEDLERVRRVKIVVQFMYIVQ
jgi:hypothetical protein